MIPKPNPNWCGDDDCPHCQGHDEGPPGSPDCPNAEPPFATNYHRHGPRITKIVHHKVDSVHDGRVTAQCGSGFDVPQSTFTHHEQNLGVNNKCQSCWRELREGDDGK